MSRFRVFVKRDINGRAIDVIDCLSATIRRDALSSANSSFVLSRKPNAQEDDILGLFDSTGKVYYTGVIKRVNDIDNGEDEESHEIETNQILGVFDDNWLWRQPNKTTIEASLKDIIDTDFKGNADPYMRVKYNYTVTTTTSTTATFPENDRSNYVVKFEKFLYDIYNIYGVLVDIDVPFNGASSISIGKNEAPQIKVGNNVLAIKNLSPISEIVGNNKLIVYSRDGLLHRGTYYAAPNGQIGTTSTDRYPKIKTVYVFSDEDPIEKIVSDNLPTQMYNHQVTFDLVLENNLYNFQNMAIGQSLGIWKNGEYYDSVMTGYEMSFREGEDIMSVRVICGKARVGLDSYIKQLISES